MPVKHSCSCGKVLQIKDELVGKKLKCPGCQKVFVAGGGAPPGPVKSPPKPAPPAAKPKPPAKPSPAPPAAKGAPTPKRAPAPKPLPPTEDEDFFTDVADEPPPRKPARTPPPRYQAEDEEDEDETAEAPAPAMPKGKADRGGKKSSKLLLILLLVLLLVGGGGGGGYYFLILKPSQTPSKGGPTPTKTGDNQPPGNQEQPKPEPQPEPEKPDPSKETLPPPKTAPGDEDLALVPGNALAFFSFNGAAWNAPLLESFRKLLGPKAEEAFVQKTGFAIANLERVSAFLVGSVAEAAQKPTEPQAVVLIKLKQAVDQEKVTKALLQGANILPGTTVTFRGDKIIAVGPEPLVKKALEAKDRPPASERLQQALALAGKGKTLVATILIPPQDAENLRKMAEADPKTPPFLKPFLQLQGDFLFTLELDEALKLTLTMGMTDAEAAETAKKAGEALVAQAKEQFKEFLAKQPEAALVQPLVDAALANITFEATDRLLQIDFLADQKMAGLASMAIPLLMKMQAGNKDKEPTKKEEDKTDPKKEDKKDDKETKEASSSGQMQVTTVVVCAQSLIAGDETDGWAGGDDHRNFPPCRLALGGTPGSLRRACRSEADFGLPRFRQAAD